MIAQDWAKARELVYEIDCCGLAETERKVRGTDECPACVETLATALATARQDGINAAIAIAARVANELTASGTGNQHTDRAQGAWRVHKALRGES